MRVRLIIALLMLLQVSVVNAASPDDYRNWYQIEVVIFAQRSPTPGDEVWTIRDLRYPATMLQVARDEPAPFLLEQLGELAQYAALMRGEVSSNGSTGADLFLFEGRSRARRNPLQNQLTPARPGESIVLAPEVNLAEILVPAGPQPFAMLAPEELVLSRIAGSVNRSSRYRMLLHQAWRQPLLAGAEATHILFQAGSRYADWYELDGTLSFRRSRFLHVDANLWFTRFAEMQDQVTPTMPIDIDAETRRRYPDLVKAAQSSAAWIPVHTHRMATSRRMRSSTLHYLDHPYFGVIVQIDEISYAPPE